MGVKRILKDVLLLQNVLRMYYELMIFDIYISEKQAVQGKRECHKSTLIERALEAKRPEKYHESTTCTVFISNIKYTFHFFTH